MDALPPEFLILVVAIVSALAGGLLTWIVSYISGGGKSKRQHRRLPAATAQGESEAPAPAGEQELLRVSRTKKGRLAVFVQGQRYRRLLEITEPQVGRETIAALKAVLTFAEGWLPSTLQSPSQPAPRRSTVDEEAFLEQLRQSDLFSLDKPSGLRGRPRRRPSSPRQLEPLLTPADEINDLVRQRVGLPATMFKAPAHPRCRCYTRPTLLPNGEWVVVWSTARDDTVCRQPIQTPWGRVNGCRELHGMIVSEGNYAGRKLSDVRIELRD